MKALVLAWRAGLASYPAIQAGQNLVSPYEDAELTQMWKLGVKDGEAMAQGKSAGGAA